MAYQIINQGSVTPGRLRALLDLFAILPKKTATQDYVSEMLQPGEKSKEATKYSLEAAEKMGFVVKSKKGLYSLGGTSEPIDSMEAYKRLIGQKLLAELPEILGRDNDIFTLYAAWSITTSDQYCFLSDDEKFKRFREVAAHPDKKGTLFNPTKYAAWKRWAVYLGLGSIYEKGFVPCPANRIWNELQAIFAKSERLSAKDFFAKLAKACPELDGGSNFNKFSKVGGLTKNHVSCATSMALRLLHDERKIHLEETHDAEMWTLWEDKAHPQKLFSHVTASLMETPI